MIPTGKALEDWKRRVAWGMGPKTWAEAAQQGPFFWKPDESKRPKSPPK